DIGGELGSAGRELSAGFAQVFCLMAQRAESGVEFRHLRAQFGGLCGKRGAFGGRLCAEFGELLMLGGKLSCLFFAALAFAGGSRELLRKLGDTLFLTGVETRCLFEVGVGIAAALFEACKRCCCSGSG